MDAITGDDLCHDRGVEQPDDYHVIYESREIKTCRQVGGG